MDAYQYGPFGRPQSDCRAAPRVLAGVALLVTALAIAAVLFLPAGEEGVGGEEADVPILGVSHLVYPSEVVQELAQPTGEDWLFPAASVEAGGAVFVLDSGNNRVLKLDPSETVVVDVLGDGPGEPALNGAIAMATDGQRLYIANSLASQVIVMGLDGDAERVLTLAKSPGDAKDPRPIGIAVAQGGQTVVSDANNHRVLWLDADGNVVWSVGTGARAGGEDGFNVPSGLATDAIGNVYVVDTLSGRVVELSPDGAFVRQFGKLGDTAGALARPKGVAIDAAGRVFVSDSLRAAVEVFGPDGSYQGMIGRKSADDAASGSIFHAPGSLRLTGNTLYVTDRMGGLITLRLLEPSAATAE